MEKRQASRIRRIDKMAKTKYIAYGSNLNLEQMAVRCPTAKPVGSGMLKGWQLTFRRVATLEPDPSAETPVGVWELEPQDEAALDRYEGYPYYYRKENIEVEVRGEKMTAMVYLMNGGQPQMPAMSYYKCIAEGYDDTGLDITYLDNALKDTQARLLKKRGGQ
jgi:gamma-glutamylcyclotransferase (GGCT)/AIG2-like uncharacterized protein YtfP